MQNDQQAIRTLVANWMAATAQGDDGQVLALLSEDVLFLTPGRPPMNKRDFAASQSAMKQFRIQGECDIQEIQVFVDYAYLWNKLAIVVTPNGGSTPIKRAGSALSILRREEGQWRFFRDANLLTLQS